LGWRKEEESCCFDLLGQWKLAAILPWLSFSEVSFLNLSVSFSLLGSDSTWIVGGLEVLKGRKKRKKSFSKGKIQSSSSFFVFVFCFFLLLKFNLTSSLSYELEGEGEEGHLELDAR